MPTNKINGLPIALDRAFNRIVCYQVATSGREADEVIALLPFIVSLGLEQELAACKGAHRYDPDSKRAYSFELECNRLRIWIWTGRHVDQPRTTLRYRPHGPYDVS